MSTQVFVLLHAHETSPGQEDIKLIGVYSTEAKADSALRRSESLPGFSSSREGFHIQAYQLDKDHWAEGFVTRLTPPTPPSKRRRDAKAKAKIGGRNARRRPRDA
jgi:hypothetical protein